MVLNVYQRARIVSIFERDFKFEKNKLKKIKDKAASENIIISESTITTIIMSWLNNGKS